MKKIKIYLFSIVSLSVLNSCNDLTDINQNPNSPTDVPTYSFIAPIQAQIGNSIANDIRYVGRYVQYFSSATAGNNWDRFGYDPNSDNGGEIWRMAYWGIGRNLVTLEEQAKAEARLDIEGFARIISGWRWQITTDYHGELIKLDQVGNASLLSYDYDNQENVYKAVVQQVKEGIDIFNKIDSLKTTAEKSQMRSYFAQGDLIYGGDYTKWKKFAYGVLARNAHNLSNKSVGYDAKKVIEYCDKSILETADNANVRFEGSIDGNRSYLAPGAGTYAAFRQSDYIVKSLDGASGNIYEGIVDPRMSRILVPSPDRIYRGNPLDITAVAWNANSPSQQQIPDFYGRVNPAATTNGRYLFRANASFPIMTATEINFIKAEAAFISNDKVTALAAYKKGIEESFKLINLYAEQQITSTEITTYTSNTKIVPTNANDLTLSMIMHQKYIGLYIFGALETWTDMRRHHYSTTIYPQLNLILRNGYYIDNGGALPYRVRPRYNSEYIWNVNALESIGATTRFYHTKEMWFSSK